MPDNKHSWPEVLLTCPDENAKRIYEKDWSENPLGKIESWSPSFITILTTSMGSQFPALMLWGPDFITFFNAAYGAILGDKQYWALGTPLQEVWPEAWESLYGMLKGVIATGKGSWAEDQIYFLHRNGFPEESYFTFSFARIIDDRGDFGGILCTAIETTQKVISERRLKALRELGNRASLQDTVQGVCSESVEVMKQLNRDIPFAVLRMISPDGLKAEVNASFGIDTPNRFINLSETTSQPMFKQVSESGVACLIKQFPPDIKFHKSEIGLDPVKSAFVLPIKTSLNSPVSGFLSVGLSPHLPFDEAYRSFLDLLAGQVSAAVASAKIQEEAREREIKLAELDQIKTTFFSNVSHEFRTPLTLLLGPLEDALEKEKGANINFGRGEFESVYRNALRLLKLVNSLLDFTRMEVGRVEASFEPVDLAGYTKELASQFHPVMQKGDLKLKIKTDVIPEPIYVDLEMWEKIVLNLLSNAFKFTFKGSVKVCLKNFPNEVEFSVQDSGIGISKTELPKIFNRFHRVEGAKSRTFEGSGIGLALITDMVNAHSGNINVESTEGKGTLFRVTIPKGYLHLPPGQVKTKSNVQSYSKKYRGFIEEAARWVPEFSNNNIPNNATKPVILVVDDNSDMRDYLLRMLVQNYSVLLAGNGREALRIIQNRIPDLIISDIMMPEMNGFELLKELRRQETTSRLPIILLSARAGNEATIEGLQAGADDYLVKPFSGKELLARVNTQLTMVRLRSDLESERRALLARDEFLSIASHELNTPLTPLKLQVQSLNRIIDRGNLSTLAPERLKIMISVFERQVDKISKLIRDLLDVTRISQGSMDLIKQKTPLNELIRQVLEDHREVILQSKCIVTESLNGNIILALDSTRIEQVLTNLLTNALKYAPGKPIKISTTINDDKAILTVEDKGPGILKVNLSKIFDRYERINASTNLGGLGLGLYISKQIVEAHNGEIQVKSVKGKGTRFIVELPL